MRMFDFFTMMIAGDVHRMANLEERRLKAEHPELFRERDFTDFGCREDFSYRWEDKEGWDLFKNNG